MSVRVKWKGAKAFSRKLNTMSAQVPARAGAALKTEGEALVKNAQANYVPVDDDVLRQTGKVEVLPAMGRMGVEAIVSFGEGGASEYAIPVHEHLSQWSPPTWKAAELTGKGINWTKPGTGPKYLELPLGEARIGFASRIAMAIFKGWK